jgi:hypothetical protein
VRTRIFGNSGSLRSGAMKTIKRFFFQVIQVGGFMVQQVNALHFFSDGLSSLTATEFRIT